MMRKSNPIGKQDYKKMTRDHFKQSPKGDVELVCIKGLLLFAVVMESVRQEVDYPPN